MVNIKSQVSNVVLISMTPSGSFHILVILTVGTNYCHRPDVRKEMNEFLINVTFLEGEVCVYKCVKTYLLMCVFVYKYPLCIPNLQDTHSY